MPDQLSLDFKKENISKEDYFRENGHPIEIQEVTGQGRFAVASRDLKEGDLVLKCSSFGIGIFYDCRKDLCSVCFSDSLDGMPLKCSQCPVYYCSKDCQAISKSFHKKYKCALAENISKLSENQVQKWIHAASKKFKDQELFEVYCRLDIQNLALWMLDYCLRIHLEPSVDIQDSTSRQALDLVSHYESSPIEEKIQIEFLYDCLISIPQPASGFMSFKKLIQSVFKNHKELGHVIGIRQSNGFGLWDSAGECLGIGLYPFASYFNHSCSPNLKRNTGMIEFTSDYIERRSTLMEKINWCLGCDLDSILQDPESISPETSFLLTFRMAPCLEFTARQNIPKGESLTHCYIDGTLPFESRQTLLKDGYFFDCACSKCVQEFTISNLNL
jgi:hypothetical protein